MAMNFSSNGRKVEEPPQIIKANIYDNPQFALDLVAHICTEKEDIEIDSFFDVYKQKRENLINEISDLDDKLSRNDETSKSFWGSYVEPLLKTLKYLYREACDAVLNTSSSKLKIAVAGGYSAGKSSLLNALTAIGDKLPTGIEPVSIVNTQLNCKTRKSTDEELAIRGINLADKYVKLDEEVLSCIQHTSKNNISLTSVLKSIILDIPSPNFLDGITFVDTPGYNNSPGKNKENNASDSDTARKGIDTSDIVFWCIDIDAGAITGKDFDILSKIDGKEKPTFIFFTKMDKKSESERNKIISLATNQVNQKLKNCHGVAGISSVNGKINFYSPTPEFSVIDDIVKFVSRKYAKESLTDNFIKQLENQFDEVIKFLEHCINECESNRLKMIDRKNQIPERLRTYKKEKSETAEILAKNNPTIDLSNAINAIETIVNQGFYKFRSILKFLKGDATFDEIVPYQKDMIDDYGKTIIKMYLDREQNPIVSNWMEKILKFNHILESPYRDFLQASRQLLEAFNNDSAPNSELIENVMALYDDTIKHYEEMENSYYQDITIVRSDMDVYDEIRKLLCNYKQQLSNALKYAYLNAKQKVQDHLQELKSPKEKTKEIVKNNIFTAIDKDDYKAFVKCFAGNGVDMKKERCNGYSPLTYAVSQGNNLMVKFFIQHGAKLTAKDSNGCNAFETAVKFHYQDICEILLAADDSLPSKCGDLKELYNQNSFINYINDKLK